MAMRRDFFFFYQNIWVTVLQEQDTFVRKSFAAVRNELSSVFGFYYGPVEWQIKEEFVPDIT